jgi:hypothetical protein
VDHELGATDADARDGARVAAHDDRAAVHVVTEAPADVVVHFEARLVGEPRAEVSRGTLHVHVDRIGQADADVVARVGIDDGDVLAAGADKLVGLADRRDG